MSASRSVQLIPLPGLPFVKPGDEIAELICDSLDMHGLSLEDGDVLVVAQKVVSKAEDRFVALDEVEPSQTARDLATVVLKDARLVELILRQSRRIVRQAPNVLIVEHTLGFVMANAGIDQSNVAAASGAKALLLPVNPDLSAEHLRDDVRARTGREVAVIINDSFGRAWRQGTVGVAIGAAGLPTLLDRRGYRDLFGRTLEVTVIGFADEIAAAASLVMGAGDEGQPVVLVRGLSWTDSSQPARVICRPASEDLFR
jgi:coenzyme F420-0:L-glutamate ligase / coenzyme F420-1:gamma-L-glutamate ligase